MARTLLKATYSHSSHSMARQATMWARGGGLALVLSIAVSLALLSSYSCSPIEPGAAGQLPAAVAAPTSVHSAVQYAVLTAKQRSSECIPVGGDVLRGLLLHVAFNSCLGFPGEGPPKRFGRPLLCHWQAAD